mgnify:CR=1 FL=1
MTGFNVLIRNVNYIKNLKNGDQILFDYAKNMYINKDVNLLASYKEKNIEENVRR